MPTRRFLLASTVPAVLSTAAFAAPADSFHSFLNGVRAEARKSGIRAATLDSAFTGIAPNQKVLDRDHHQPESTWTWARYRGVVITDKRISDGREAFAANRELFQRVEQHYGVGAGVKALLRKKDDTLAGLVADRVEAPHAYVPALAGLLGSRLQDVVVRDMERGAELLHALAEGRRGRATIVPVMAGVLS